MLLNKTHSSNVQTKLRVFLLSVSKNRIYLFFNTNLVLTLYFIFTVCHSLKIICSDAVQTSGWSLEILLLLHLSETCFEFPDSHVFCFYFLSFIQKCDRNKPTINETDSRK